MLQNCTILYYIISYDTILCDILSNQIQLFITQYNSVSCFMIQYHIMIQCLCNNIIFKNYTIQYYFISYDISYDTILYSIIGCKSYAI